MAGEVIPPSQVIQVSTKDELSRTVSMYMSQGFEIIAQGPTSVSLIKRKKFQVWWAVVGFVLCTIPLFAYLIYYEFFQSDRLVEVRLVSPGPVASIEARESSSAVPGEEAGPPPGAGSVPPQLSPDGNHWWDGTRWHRVSS